MKKQRLLVIVGPTASGKSELAVKLALALNGEVISADSRQIYKGLNIGSGKVPGRWRRAVFYYKAVPHHTIDLANPKRQLSAAQFQRLAKKAISDIIRRGKLPILCGGTAHWVDAVVYDQKFPKVKPNARLRRELENKTTQQLFAQLRKLDPQRAKTIDRYNPRRLIRALEIVLATGQAVPQLAQSSKFDVTWVGVNPGSEKVNKNIAVREKQNLKKGLLQEVELLHKQGLSWQRLEDLGLEYKFAALYLQKKLTLVEMTEQLNTAIKRYAKRQMTWWKRNPNIHWIKSQRQLNRKALVKLAP